MVPTSVWHAARKIARSGCGIPWSSGGPPEARDRDHDAVLAARVVDGLGSGGSRPGRGDELDIGPSSRPPRRSQVRASRRFDVMRMLSDASASPRGRTPELVGGDLGDQVPSKPKRPHTDPLKYP